MLSFLKAVFSHFGKSDTSTKAAAMAYNVAFSFLPTAVILISLAALFFGKEAASGEIFDQLKDTLGQKGAEQIQAIIKDQHVNHSSVLTTILGFATLILSASGLFSQVYDAFNSVWNIEEKKGNGLLKYISKHLVSFVVLVWLFFLLLISASASTFLVRHASHLIDHARQWYLYEHLISLVVFSLGFAMIFRFLGDAKVHWKVALYGGVFTSFLFLIGKVGIGLYIGRSHLSSTFGSAAALAMLMLWVYYVSQIIFLGASFVKVLADRLNLPIES